MSPAQGKLLCLLLRAFGARQVVEVRVGDAAQTLANIGVVHALSLDGHKAAYEAVLGVVAPTLRPGGLVADNIFTFPEMLRGDRARMQTAAGFVRLPVPLGGGMELSLEL